MNKSYDPKSAPVPVARELAIEKEKTSDNPEILLKISESLNRIAQDINAPHQSIKK
ncbi:MAG: hypothetical protein PVH61_36515 [Candidatus Aminicenantes bacterium]|jgi:hypothetical protein